MHVVAIIAAGGRGTRLGAAVPKQLRSVGGRPILQRSFETFARHDRVHEIVLTVPSEIAARPPEYLRHPRKPVFVVAGGERRQDSVSNAFDRVSSRADVVVVHDAARPFASDELITRVIDAAGEAGAAVAAVQARDTVKEAVIDVGTLVVRRTLPREVIFLAQTPQAFRRDVLADAIALGRQGPEATDEAALAERAGHLVRIVEGEPWNIKITTADDLRVARGLMQDAPQETGLLRIGTGYDLHRLVEGRPLVLGGVTIPHAKGLAGHSDADALCHAISDAILGAAGAGDIGRHFPDTNPRWAGASSLDLLARATDIVRQAGFAVINVDAVVIAERPKLGPYLDGMREHLAQAIGVDASCVSIKGKTNEGVGELGRNEAIAVHAVAMISRQSTVDSQQSTVNSR